MWCVRLGYKMPDASFEYEYNFFGSNKERALAYAKFRRRSLNSWWKVEVLRLVPSSVECVA